MQNLAAVTVSAEIMGREAFARGVKCAPCLDAALTALVGLLALPMGGSLPVLASWSRGWTRANLAAPLV